MFTSEEKPFLRVRPLDSDDGPRSDIHRLLRASRHTAHVHHGRRHRQIPFRTRDSLLREAPGHHCVVRVRDGRHKGLSDGRRNRFHRLTVGLPLIATPCSMVFDIHCLRKVRRRRTHGDDDTEEDERLQLPIVSYFALVVGYCALGSLLFNSFEKGAVW